MIIINSEKYSQIFVSFELNQLEEGHCVFLNRLCAPKWTQHSWCFWDGNSCGPESELDTSVVTNPNNIADSGACQPHTVFATKSSVQQLPIDLGEKTRAREPQNWFLWATAWFLCFLWALGSSSVSALREPLQG